MHGPDYLITDRVPPTGGGVRPRLLLRRLWRVADVMVPGVLLSLVLFVCFVWPAVFPLPDPVGASVLDANLPPLSPGHLLGTDPNGNDLWSRLLYGGRASLFIAFSANGLGLLLGASLGAWSAYCGGMVDAVLMRLLDIFIAFPSLVLVLAIAQALGPGSMSSIMALLCFSVPAFARIARANTLSLRERPFMLAAELAGTSGWKMLFRHIAPNIAPGLLAFALLGIGIAIILEGALSFLGLGVQPPAPSWGGMILQGQQAITARPMLVLLPGLLLFMTVLSCNLLGAALRIRWSHAS